MDFKARFFPDSDSQGIEVEARLMDQDIQFSISVSERFNWPISQIRLRFLAGSKKLILENPQSGFANLLVADESVSDQILKQWPLRKNKPKGLKLPVFGALAALLAFLFLLVGLIFIFWKSSPVLADFFADKIPLEWEQKTGDQMYESLMKTESVDKLKSRYLQEFYSLLQPLSDPNSSSQRTISLTVVTNPQFNAFAIPGRHIIIYSGVFKKVQTPDQLMALIGHEAGHVENRHSLRSIVRAGAIYMMFSLAFGDMTGLSAILVDNAQSLQNLSYSRDFEREADLESHNFLCQNGASPKAVIELMRILDGLGAEQSEEVPGFLQSHPSTKERLQLAINQSNNNDCPGNNSLSLKLKEIFNQIKQEAQTNQP
jgi:predicted Zn-dependent protease